MSLCSALLWGCELEFLFGDSQRITVEISIQAYATLFAAFNICIHIKWRIAVCGACQRKRISQRIFGEAAKQTCLMTRTVDNCFIYLIFDSKKRETGSLAQSKRKVFLLSSSLTVYLCLNWTRRKCNETHTMCRSWYRRSNPQCQSS